MCRQLETVWRKGARVRTGTALQRTQAEICDGAGRLRQMRKGDARAREGLALSLHSKIRLKTNAARRGLFFRARIRSGALPRYGRGARHNPKSA